MDAPVNFDGALYGAARSLGKAMRLKYPKPDLENLPDFV